MSNSKHSRLFYSICETKRYCLSREFFRIPLRTYTLPRIAVGLGADFSRRENFNFTLDPAFESVFFDSQVVSGLQVQPKTL